MSNSIQPYHWRIGGPQGSGIDKSANLFARACLLAGYPVLGRREYHSNIMGRHSYVDIASAAVAPQSVAERVDMLVGYEPETLFRHLFAVKPGGVALYDSGSETVSMQGLAYLDPSLRETLASRTGGGDTLAELIVVGRGEGVTCYGVAFAELIHDIADELGCRPKEARRALNTLAVALSAALVGLSREGVTAAVGQLFAGNTAHIRLNSAAVAHAFDYVEQQGWAPRSLPPGAVRRERLLLNASQSVALGKLAAGLGLQSYYPISPASDESAFLEANPLVPTHTGHTLTPMVLQVEDEIAAIGTAIGAALTGVRAATATSGPGFSLMTEGLGWAGMNEVPLVVTHYQRGGPSTGMPTRTEQGDLQFAIHGGHGEFPRMVIASGSVEEAFYDAMHAFNYAEQFQLPVIHLLDKQLTSSFETLDRLEPERVHIERGALCGDKPDGTARVRPFLLTEEGISPRPLLGVPGCQHWRTGVEHDEYGLVTEDPALRERMMEKRAAKHALILERLPREALYQAYGDADAPLLLIGWGSTRGALLDALSRLENDGIAARVVVVRLLWPFPAEALQTELARAETTVAVEGNYSGQFASLLREQTGHRCDHLIVKYSGRPICGDALAAALRRIDAGEGEARMVLRNPYE